MTFGNWDESIHRKYEQVGRRKRASSVVLENVNPNDGTALAVGSGEEPYKVTLENCTCTSFIQTNRPCKHMYRLAEELGLIDELPKKEKEAAKRFKDNLPTEIKRFEELYFSGAITAEKYAAIVKALEK